MASKKKKTTRKASKTLEKVTEEVRTAEESSHKVANEETGDKKKNIPDKNKYHKQVCIYAFNKK